MKCPKCRHDNSPDSAFFAKCGSSLGPFPETQDVGTETYQAVHEELTTGSVLAGRYQIIEELGRGGWAGSTGPWTGRSTKRSL